MSLSHNEFGLTDQHMQYFNSIGISTFLPWQIECFKEIKTFVCDKNFVFSAPSGAGKSAVADLFMLNTLMDRKLKAIIIEPYAAICTQKVQLLKKSTLQEKKIDAFFRGSGTLRDFNNVDIAICTIERANSFLNWLYKENKISEFGIVIVDEIHMLAYLNRGMILENIITRLIYQNYLNQQRLTTEKNTKMQIVGMSASISNLQDLAKWLDAKHYETMNNPVKVTQYFILNNFRYKIKPSAIGAKPRAENSFPEIESHEIQKNLIDIFEIKGQIDDAAAIYYAMDAIARGYSALVFCRSQDNCEETAKAIAWQIFNTTNKKTHFLSKNVLPSQKAISKFIDQLASLRSGKNLEKLNKLKQTLKQETGSLSKNLETSLEYGIAFHHAGLTNEERIIIEQDFSQKTIKVLCCTTTLAMGVNFPVQRVINKALYPSSGKHIDIPTYRQKIGRAGRFGISEEGESITICTGKLSDLPNTIKQYSESSLPEVKSKLLHKGNPSDVYGLTVPQDFKRTLLELICSCKVIEIAEIKEYFFKHSFYFKPFPLNLNEKTENEFQDKILSNLNVLSEKKLVTIGHDTIIRPTVLGFATVASGISPEYVNQLMILLKNNQLNSFEEINSFYIVYLLTPPCILKSINQIDWNNFKKIKSTFCEEVKKVADEIQIDGSYIEENILSPKQLKNEISEKFDPTHKLVIHMRFYLSLVLFSAVKGLSMEKIEKLYLIKRGKVQNLQQEASTFAGMISIFVKSQENEQGYVHWKTIATTLEAYRDHFRYGSEFDLSRLMRIKNCMTPSIAKKLFSKNITSLDSLAQCQLVEIENAISDKTTNTSPSTSNAKQQNSEMFSFSLHKFITVNEMAMRLQNEARMILYEEKQRDENMN